MNELIMNEQTLESIIASSVGQVRLEAIFRRGLYTTSCKVRDVAKGVTQLVKVSTRHVDVNEGKGDLQYEDLSNESSVVFVRPWIGLCLADRIYQYPYPGPVERSWIRECLRRKGVEFVKRSNVLLTNWRKVYVVDGTFHTSEKEYALLDSTEEPVSIDDVFGEHDDVSFPSFWYEYIQGLAIFTNINADFEPAAETAPRVIKTKF